jgi:hypothetical protein
VLGSHLGHTAIPKQNKIVIIPTPKKIFAVYQHLGYHDQILSYNIITISPSLRSLACCLDFWARRTCRYAGVTGRIR